MLRSPRVRGACGFTLVGMVIVFTVMTVLVAAALPSWTKVMQREREEELIFRGLQYAEAIRVFQARNGRYPLQLEELIKVRPRSIRKLWQDPMTEEGEWGLVYAQVGSDRRGRRRSGSTLGQPSQPQTFGGSAPRPLGGEKPEDPSGRRVAAAPIIGVHSLSDEVAAKDFFGGEKYSDWLFAVQIVPVATLTPDTLSPARANSRWVGRPFRPDLGPAPGSAPVVEGGTPGSKQSRRRSSQSDD